MARLYYAAKLIRCYDCLKKTKFLISSLSLPFENRERTSEIPSYFLSQLSYERWGLNNRYGSLMSFIKKCKREREPNDTLYRSTCSLHLLTLCNFTSAPNEINNRVVKRKIYVEQRSRNTLLIDLYLFWCKI